jgi:hypothetical protein
MDAAWEQGEHIHAEALLPHDMDAEKRRDAILDLLYEEMCLRRRYGLSLDADAITRRLPSLRQEIAVLLRCAFEQPESRWVSASPQRDKPGVARTPVWLAFDRIAHFSSRRFSRVSP